MGAADAFTKEWKSRSAVTTTNLSVMCYMVIAMVLLFSKLQLAHCRQSMILSNHDSLDSEAKEQVEADFLRWVAWIGANSRATTSSPARIHPSGVKAVPQVYYVDIAGYGNFKTLQEAVNAIPEGNSMRVLIVVKAGTYRYGHFHANHRLASILWIWI